MITVHCDGASKGNPGPASCGFVILNDGNIIAKDSIPLGNTTNNVAEYYGVIHALDKLIEMGIKEFRLIADSQLVINQLNGIYKVKNENMKKLNDVVKNKLCSFDKYQFVHTKRDGNSIADKAANDAFR
jgi:ribonuclease HI